MNPQIYFDKLDEGVKKVYGMASEARAKGLDPVSKVEVPLAKTMAQKCVELIATKYPQMSGCGIDERILEMEREYGKLDTTIVFKIAEEVAKQKFCEFENLLQAIDAGIRLGFAYATIGVVASPIEGYTELKIGKTKEGKEYFKAYFSGPIRSAGTTASCVALMLIDFMRESFGYAKYDPSEEEVKRYVTENVDYHERVTNLQYFPLEEEMAFLASHIPIQIAGEPTEKLEVSNYKNLERVETNFIRGGMCLIFSEGLAQKAAKGFRLYNGAKQNGVKMTGFDWIPEYIELHEKLTSGKKKEKGVGGAVYLKDLVAGRPVFGHPSRSGAFRFRYGRGRVSGFSAVSVHPATMAVTDSFIATGTQLKLEKPTKGCVTTVCDKIDGPIVKLVNGSVKKLKTIEEAKRLYSNIDEIIYLGDILFPFSDVVNRNAELIRPGYVEEWWELELAPRVYPEESSQKIITRDKKGGVVEDCFNIGFDEAVELSKKYGVSLHPKFIFYWTEISKERFLSFLSWLKHSQVRMGKLVFPYNSSEKEKFSEGKRALELLGVEHEVTIENVVLSRENSKALLSNLGLKFVEEENYLMRGNVEELIKNLMNGKGIGGLGDKEKSVLEIVNLFSEFGIRDKAGEFIGSRMGRPEKAKLRKLTGSPNVLFPVGQEGGRLRSVQAACEVGKVKGSFPIYHCNKCEKDTIYRVCENCGEKTQEMFYCRQCGEKSFQPCEEHEESHKFQTFNLDIKSYFDSAVKMLGLERQDIPVLIKGVRGTSSKNHQMENLAKGLLRAKYDLQVNKDGTIRFDVTELPVVSFKPKEILVGVDKLKELGYTHDISGKELVDDEQIVELMPHDILLPISSEYLDERADEVFIKTCGFIDELLGKFYGLKPFYDVKKRDDLVGKLGVCMAPHNCAGVICRFIGFSSALGLFASPFMHAAIRRDCVYPTTNFVYFDGKGNLNNKGIGNFVENLISNGNKTKEIDSYGTLRIDLKDNQELYSIGVDPKSKKLKKKKIKYFVKGAPPEKWIEMKTCSGRKQVMTPRHKFIYLDKENNFKVKTANEIKKGDRIAVLNKLEQSDFITKLFLPELLAVNVPKEKQTEIRVCGASDFFKRIVKKIGEKKIRKLLKMEGFNNLLDWYKIVPLNQVHVLIEKGFFKWEDLPNESYLRTIFNNKRWDLWLDVNRELMSILGYYSAEGYSRQNKSVSQICFRILDKNQRDKLVIAIKNAFGLKVSLGEEDSKITLSNRLIYHLFTSCFKCGKKAYSKKVPEIVYNVKDDFVLEYLSCYFDGDGTIVDSKGKRFVTFYSVSRNLLDGVSLLGTRFGIFGKFYQTKERAPGKKILERYLELGKEPKKHVLHHLIYCSYDFYKIIDLLKPVSERKLKILKNVEKKTVVRKIKFDHKYYLAEKQGDVLVDIVNEVNVIRGNENSYCFEVEWESEEDKNVLWGEQIINARCDGDEAAIMLLGDVLLNFSREFLPSHRGGTQDAPLVLNSRIDAGEVDDQILDFEYCDGYPLELYEKAEKKLHSSKVKGIKLCKDVLREGGNPFEGIGFTHDTNNFNDTVICSSYKTLATMQDKVEHQMALVEKLRCVDTSDVARLIIDRHFIRDMRGNLRKFSMQGFRCVSCNEIMRRPPLSGVCPKCRGKIIFTIHEGGIKKYLELALTLARKYNLSPYMQQNLELVKRYIDSIFGKELERQEGLEKWF